MARLKNTKPFQFGLRSLFLVTAAIAIAFGGLKWLGPKEFLWVVFIITPSATIIGAPGFGCGWAPAISFTSTNPDAILSAYVTPMPEVSRLDGNGNDWQRVRRGVLAVYG